MARLYPFKYYGSKYRSLNFVLDKLPVTENYVEPFAGSAIVLLNKEPSMHEVLNDLNGEITNFFKVLRDNPHELVRVLERTPHSRNEYEKAIERRGDDTYDNVERARCFFVRTQQGRYGHRGDAQTKGEWARSTTQSRNGVPMKVSGMMNKVDGLESVANRLRQVQIEALDAVKIIKDYDNPETLFYLDPPYVPESRSGSGDAYGSFDMERSDHIELLETLDGVDGNVALSGYDNSLYSSRLDGWFITKNGEKTNQNGSTGNSSDNSTTEEVLWTNYDPRMIDEQS